MTRNIILSGLVVALFCAQCKKNGTGGKARVATEVKHHERAIPGATVYVNYGAGEFPGSEPALYDDSRVCDPAGTVTFENLLPGEYFFFGVGFDSLIQEEVTGGAPLTIKRKDRKSEIQMLVPVSE